MKKLLSRVKKSNKGFTLVELIIVIAIIAVLTAVLAPQYVKYVEKSRVASDNQMAETLLSEVQTAIADAGSDGTTFTAGTITVNSSGASDSGTIGTTMLAGIDSNWSNAKVKNKAGSPGSTYKITYTASSATGAWS